MPATKPPSRIGRTSLEKRAIGPPKDAPYEMHPYEQDTMDLGYMDHGSPFDLPKGASPDMIDIRFENGGIRKDFGWVNVGAAAATRVRDTGVYEVINPFTLVRTTKPYRIYRNGAGNAEVQFLVAGVWGGTTAGSPMQDVPVKACNIQGFLCWADGEKIHFYTEGSEVTDGLDQFTNGGAVPGTGPNGELILVGEFHELTFTNAPINFEFTVNWSFEAISGLGPVTVAFEGFVGGVWNVTSPIMERVYEVVGPRVWADEFANISRTDIVAVATKFRLRIKAAAALHGFPAPTFKAAGFGATVPADPYPGTTYKYFPAVATSLTSITVPKAAYVFPFEDRLIALGGNDDPTRVASSIDGEPKHFNLRGPNLEFTGAFQISYLDTVAATKPIDDMMCAGKVANNVAAVIRRRSILRMEETGDPLQVPLALYDWIDGLGTNSPKALAQTADGICFLGHDWMVYYLSGNQLMPIGEAIQQRLIEDLAEASLPYVEAKYDSKFREYHLGIPESSGVGLTMWWIFDLGRLLDRQQKVWRPRLATGLGTCGAVLSPPANPAPPADIPPPSPVPLPDPDPHEECIEGDCFEPQLFDGFPFENVYADSRVWIGNLYSASWLKLFDVVSDVETNINYPAGGGTNFGFGHAYIAPRKEMWVLGRIFPDTTIFVYDTLTLAHKATYTYPDHATSVPRAIHYIASVDRIFASMLKTSGTAANRVNAVAINPATGTITNEYRPTIEADDTCDQIITDFVTSFTWAADESLVYASILRDNVYTINPVTHATSKASGYVSGVIDTGGQETEMEYAEDGNIYLVTDKFDPIYRFATKPADANSCNTSAAAIWKSWAGGQADPDGICCCAVPYLNAIAVSRGHTNILFDDPTTSGRVTVYDLFSGAILRDFIVKFCPARISYVPETHSLCVVSMSVLPTETTFYKQYLPLHGIDVQPDPPPDQPTDPTLPAPVPPTPDPTPPPAGAPTITAARDYCMSTMAGGANNWTGSVAVGAEIDFVTSGWNLEIAVWPHYGNMAEGDPAVDPPSIRGGVSSDADTWRLQTYIETHTVAVTDMEKPICPGTSGLQERDAIDQFWRVRCRRDLGGGSYSDWSNHVDIRVRVPRKIVTSDPAQPAPPVGAPIWVNASVLCTDYIDPLVQVDVFGVFDAVAANYSANGEGFYPMEFLEFNSGANPAVDTPLRTKNMGIGGRIGFQWLVYRVNTPGAQCGGPSSVPNLTRDYYCRHVLDGVGGYGTLSTVRSLTFVHPGP